VEDPPGCAEMSIITVVRGLTIKNGKPHEYFSLKFEGHIKYADAKAAIIEMLEETGAQRAIKVEMLVMEDDDDDE
jgi:hypothetical protein